MFRSGLQAFPASVHLCLDFFCYPAVGFLRQMTCPAHKLQPVCDRNLLLPFLRIVVQCGNAVLYLIEGGK